MDRLWNELAGVALGRSCEPPRRSGLSGACGRAPSVIARVAGSNRLVENNAPRGSSNLFNCARPMVRSQPVYITAGVPSTSISAPQCLPLR